MGQYYKRSNIKEGYFYGPPDYIRADFSNIPARTIIVADGDRLDIMAQELFGNAGHWKALALFNNLNYFFDLTPGMILRIPHKIEDLLNRI